MDCRQRALRDRDDRAGAAKRIRQVIGGIYHVGGSDLIVVRGGAPDPIGNYPDVMVALEAIRPPAALDGIEQLAKHLVRRHVLQR